MCLFLFIDLPAQLSVYRRAFSSPLIFQTILNDPADMMEETDRSHSRTPISVCVYAVQELCGIDISVFGGRCQIGNGFVIISFDLPTI